MYRVALVDPQASTREPLCDLLRGVEAVRLEGECADYDLFRLLLRESRPDVAVVALDADYGAALRLIAELSAEFPRLCILAVSARTDTPSIRGALESGASEYLLQPPTAAELRAALARVPAVSPAPARLVRIRGRRRSASEGDEAARGAAAAPFPSKQLLRRLLRGEGQTAKRPVVSPPHTAVAGDLVDCTVFAPPEVAPGEPAFVQVFAHLPEQADLTRDTAREFDDEAARRGVTSLGVEVVRGTKLSFHLTMPGAVIDEPVQHVVWRGVPVSAQFGLHTRRQRAPGALVGTVSVCQDGVPVGHVKFKLTIGLADRRPPGAEPEQVGEAARRYRKAFVSYASPDRPEVLKRVQMLARLGIDFFQDVLKLEPGDRWEKQLYRHIDESDLFLLFWSTAASKSEWVLKEMRYALGRKGDDDLAPPEIKPVIIEGPPPPPPPAEMAHLHFNDYFLYFMTPPGTGAPA